MKCEYQGNRCKETARFKGMMYGKPFGVCLRCVVSAVKWYEIEVLRPPRPKAHFVYLPGTDGYYLAGVWMNRPWTELSPGMKRCVGKTILRLLARNRLVAVSHATKGWTRTRGTKGSGPSI